MSGTDQAARPLLRTPVISPNGQQVAFVYATDIWIVGVGGGDAERLTVYPSGHSSPVWTPDGRTLALSSPRIGNGEIYLQPLDGSLQSQITSHTTGSTPETWSPDGQFLYFSSGRDLQGSAIYRVGREGGMPIRWVGQPYEHLSNSTLSPDGTRLAFGLVRGRWWRRGPNPYSGSEIWIVSNTVAATDFQRVGAEYTGLNRWPCWAAGGQGLYVVSDRDGTENVWLLPLDGGQARQITHFTDGRVVWPSISADGSTMVFERQFGLWRLDLSSGEAAPLAVRVRAGSKYPPQRAVNVTRELGNLVLAPDGKKLAFTAHGEIFVDFADKETDKERRQGPSFRITNTPFREANPVWSPDSRTLVYTSDRDGDAELFRYDLPGGSETRLTSSGGSKWQPQYSPDGKWLAYSAGNDEIRLFDLANNSERPFVRADFSRGTTFVWSPDSCWLAFTAQDSRGFGNLHVQTIESGEAHQITFLGNTVTRWPLWSPDGQFLLATTRQARDELQIIRVDLQPRQPQFREDEFEKLFADQGTGVRGQGSGNEEPEAKSDDGGQGSGNEKPEAKSGEEASGDQQATNNGQRPPDKKATNKKTNITFDGIDRRLRVLTPPEFDAIAMAISPDSRDLIFHAMVAGKGNLWTLPLDEARADAGPRQLTSTNGAKGNVRFAPDGKSFYYVDGGQIMVRKFPNGDTTTLQVSAEAAIDFHQEKLQVFDEAWRILRDRFFDPAFRGTDWNALRAEYRPYALGAQSAGDLRTVLNLMIGELRSSHTGANGNSLPVEEGYLGVDFDAREQVASGQLRIARVTAESPAALAGILAGETLLAIDGRLLAGAIDADALLRRTSNRRVRLRVAAADGTTREVAVRPASLSSYDELCYRAWVEANERYVHAESGGRLGYVHIREMSYGAYHRLLADLDAEMHSREGVVVDVRFNPGGHVFSFILDVLSRRTLLLHGFRDFPASDSARFHGNYVLNKPTILVTNESTQSNAELLAEGYRRLGLGLIIGRPTGGAVISTQRVTLLDGTRLSVPQYRVTTLDGEDLEGTGRPVDVDVPLPLDISAHSRDPQLDTASRMLLGQIDGGEEDGTI